METFEQAKARKERATRGKYAEAEVAKALALLQAKNNNFCFERLQDGRAIGRPGVATTCDFNVFYNGKAYAVEVKNVAKGFTLRMFDQYPRMLRRERCGCRGVVFVRFGEGGWDAADIGLLAQAFLTSTGKKSWRLTPKFKNAQEAVNHYFGSQS